MAASHHVDLQSRYPPRSSYAASSLLPAKLPAQYAESMTSCGERPGLAHHAPQPINISHLVPQHHRGGAYALFTPVVMSSAGMGRDDSLSATSAPASGSQKRAYRQRRKDPSCDTCRERKVKCDATEASSCSECASRNVKCQFTKETNRRMSSIKQVQGLEKQMELMRSENSRLRRKLDETKGGPFEEDRAEHAPLHPPPIGTPPKRRNRPASKAAEAARARDKIKRRSREIWKVPTSQDPLQSGGNWQIPELPPKHTVDHLLNVYYTAMHPTTPFVHWPNLQRSVDRLYQPGNLQFASRPFLSMFFGVLAVGSLFDSHLHRSYHTAAYLESARLLQDPWANEFVLDHARTHLLVAIALNELNLKSAAWKALGCAVRVAQDLGLYAEADEWPAIEGEMRRRTWWTAYILDRGLALELGRPLMVDDSDCDVALPRGIDDHPIHDTLLKLPNTAQPSHLLLLAMVHVARAHSALDKAMASPIMGPVQLAVLDDYLHSCLGAYPDICRCQSSAPLPPPLLNPLLFLYHTRLLLHRHNLAPSVPPEARLQAVERCTLIAFETTSLVARTTSALCDGATALTTTHLFRCTLFLLLQGCFDHAWPLVRALAPLHNRRSVAAPCGRFLAFFLSMLVSKRAAYVDALRRANGLQRPTFEHDSVQVAMLHDEELLAYVGADLQAGPDAAWGRKDGDDRFDMMPTPETPRAFSTGTTSRLNEGVTSHALLSLEKDDASECGGWEAIEGLMRELENSLRPAPSSMSDAASVGCSPSLPAIGRAAGVKTEPAGPTLMPPVSTQNSLTNSPKAAAKSASQDRISIANII